MAVRPARDARRRDGRRSNRRRGRRARRLSDDHRVQRRAPACRSDGRTVTRAGRRSPMLTSARRSPLAEAGCRSISGSPTVSILRASGSWTQRTRRQLRSSMVASPNRRGLTVSARRRGELVGVATGWTDGSQSRLMRDGRGARAPTSGNRASSPRVDSSPKVATNRRRADRCRRTSCDAIPDRADGCRPGVRCPSDRWATCS